MSRATLDPHHPVLRIPLEPHQLLDRVTRVQDVIVLCHLGVPRIDERDFSLTVDGMVGRPLRLSFDELARRPRTEVAAVHQCCGSPLEPDVPKRRVTSVVWSGVRLADLLAECEPEPSARFVWSVGADHGVFDGVACDSFVKDLPIDRVAADVLVALEMNGAPLRPENGHPARLVVPGFYGTNSVKWLTRLTLAAGRATGHFTTRWYNDVVRDPSGRPTGATTPVWAIAPESAIVAPAPDQTVAAGRPVEVWGWAWADGGVDAVDVTADGGASWMRADLEPRTGRTWQRFAATWRPERRGRHELAARARSPDGREQPGMGARNAVHRVAIVVA
ncbi:MAG TPA: molybdopterin-dependent oxidoreductase [Kofleriaceae bacterium]|nr:molybdopterin-dependent oxidoreductase [Kofleriaceae bacterium]